MANMLGRHRLVALAGKLGSLVDLHRGGILPPREGRHRTNEENELQKLLHDPMTVSVRVLEETYRPCKENPKLKLSIELARY